MKTRFLNKMAGLLAVLLLFSCTGKFEEYNTDNTGFTDEQKTYDYNTFGVWLKVVQMGIYFNYDWGSGKNWHFQTMQNLNADMFSGYMHRKEKIEKIAELFARFRTEVESLNSLNLYDINVHAENVIIPILNLVYGVNLVNIGEFYQFNLSSCIRQQNSLTAQFVSFSLANLANIFYPPQFLQ